MNYRVNSQNYKPTIKEIFEKNTLVVRSRCSIYFLGTGRKWNKHTSYRIDYTHSKMESLLQFFPITRHFRDNSANTLFCCLLKNFSVLQTVFIYVLQNLHF